MLLVGFPPAIIFLFVPVLACKQCELDFDLFQTSKRHMPYLFVRGDGVILVSPPLRTSWRHFSPFVRSYCQKLQETQNSIWTDNHREPLHQRFSTNSVCWSLKRKHWQQRFFKWFCMLEPGKSWECELCDSKSWVFLDSQCQHEFFKDPLTEGMVLQTLSIDPCYTIWEMTFWMQLFISAVKLGS